MPDRPATSLDAPASPVATPQAESLPPGLFRADLPDDGVRHYHGFQVPAHLCVECGQAIECGYPADRCPGDNFRCTPCTDEVVNHNG